MPTSRSRWAVVLSSDAIGLGAVRSLREGGVPTIVVMLDRWEPVRWSRHGLKVLVPRRDDQERAILQVLDGIDRTHRPVLLPTSDYLAHVVHRHRARLEQRYRLCLPPAETLELVLDKSRDTELLAQFGVALPRTVAELPDSPDELVRRIGLPLIVKPRTYLDKRELGWRNVVARTPAHVEAFYRTQRAAFPRVVAQELVPGDDAQLWECICVFDAASELSSAFTFRKLRTMPAHYGQTTCGRSERNAEIVELARMIGKRLGYTGPADFDLKYDARDGTYKYLELNPRLGLCHWFGTRCGVNLALDAWRVACGEPAQPQPPQQDGRTFLAVLEDLGGRLGAGDSPLGAVKDLVAALRRKPVGAYFAPDDPWPGPLAALRIAVRLVSRLWRGQLGSVFTKDYDRPGGRAHARARFSGHERRRPSAVDSVSLARGRRQSDRIPLIRPPGRSSGRR